MKNIFIVLYGFIEKKNPHISGPTQFKSVFLKGQLYLEPSRREFSPEINFLWVGLLIGLKPLKLCSKFVCIHRHVFFLEQSFSLWHHWHFGPDNSLSWELSYTLEDVSHYLQPLLTRYRWYGPSHDYQKCLQTLQTSPENRRSRGRVQCFYQISERVKSCSFSVWD